MRSRNADSAATIARILAAARALLQSEGPQAVSVRSVARVSELSSGTVSYYFATREALWDGCLQAHHDRLTAIVEGHLARVAAKVPIATVVGDAARDMYRFAFAEREFIQLELAWTAERRGITDARRRRQRAQLEQVSAALQLPRDTSELWLTVQSLVYAVGRYVSASAAERAQLTGASDDEAANAMIAEHLARVASRLILPLVAGP